MTNAYWRHFGEGAADVLALHCSLAHSGAWRGVAKALKTNVVIAAMDLPSHGKSPAFDPACDIADQSLEWALAGMDRPMHLFGHSFGAYLALRIADTRPDLVLSLSLYEPVFFAAARHVDAAIYARYRDEMAGLDRLMEDGKAEEAARHFVRAWGDGRRWFDLPQEMRQGFALGMPAVLAAQSALIEDQVKLYDRLANIATPTSVLRGALSPETMALVQAELVARLPNAQAVKLEGLGHMGPITHPEPVAALFEENMNR